MRPRISGVSERSRNRTALGIFRKHGELGSLDALKPDLRFAAIKNKHGKQLLVTMREAIENNQFDAILEDEYSSIGNELAKRLYLVVCRFSQHGALLRDNLLAELPQNVPTPTCIT